MTLPELALRVGFTVGPGSKPWLIVGDPVRGKVGTGQAAGADSSVNISQWLFGGSVRRGANQTESPIIRYEAGTATFNLDNTDRRFEPTNLAGPYVAAGISQVRPMVPVWFAAKWAGISYPLWFGFADLWPCDYSTPSQAVTNLTASGPFKTMAGRGRTAVAPVGISELTGARIGRILDSIAWPANQRILAAGVTTCQATPLEDDPLGELQKVADTEAGHLFEGEQGHIVFHDRRTITSDPRAINPQITWQVATSYPFSDVGIEHENVIANQARITRIGGVEQVYDDFGSQADYLVQSPSDADLWMETDAAAAGYASMIVALGNQPSMRVASIEVNPELTPATLWPAILGAKIGDRHQVIATPPGGGSAITRDGFVRQIEHRFDRAGQWTAAFTYQAADAWAFWTVGDATLGRVGSNRVGF